MCYRNIVTITTDFGTKDTYVGVMKGVILSINPDAQLVDITHEIEPGNILEAAFLLKDAYKYFPEGTVHIVVVDPGVGGKRRPIAIKMEGFFFVGPDNGLFWPIISDKDALVVHLTNKKYFLKDISTTFHGRDIFAPAAAYISKGVDLLDMGVLINDPVRMEIEKPKFLKDKIVGYVIRADRFGNLITNISKKDIEKHFGKREDLEIEIEGRKIKGLSRTYSDVASGQLLALIGSSGFLEISVNKGSASELFGKKAKELKVNITLTQSDFDF